MRPIDIAASSSAQPCPLFLRIARLTLLPTRTPPLPPLEIVVFLRQTAIVIEGAFSSGARALQTFLQARVRLPSAANSRRLPAKAYRPRDPGLASRAQFRQPPRFLLLAPFRIGPPPTAMGHGMCGRHQQNPSQRMGEVCPSLHRPRVTSPRPQRPGRPRLRGPNLCHKRHIHQSRRLLLQRLHDPPMQSRKCPRARVCLQTRLRVQKHSLSQMRLLRPRRNPPCRSRCRQMSSPAPRPRPLWVLAHRSRLRPMRVLAAMFPRVLDRLVARLCQTHAFPSARPRSVRGRDLALTRCLIEQ